MQMFEGEWCVCAVEVDSEGGNGSGLAPQEAISNKGGEDGIHTPLGLLAQIEESRRPHALHDEHQSRGEH